MKDMEFHGAEGWSAAKGGFRGWRETGNEHSL